MKWKDDDGRGVGEPGSRLPNQFIHQDWKWNMKLERKLFDISQTQTNIWPALTIDKGVIWFHSLLQDASKRYETLLNGWMTELVLCERFGIWEEIFVVLLLINLQTLQPQS